MLKRPDNFDIGENFISSGELVKIINIRAAEIKCEYSNGQHGTWDSDGTSGDDRV